MLEVIKFIFSSFWIWLGTVVMLAIVVEGLTGIVKISIGRSHKSKDDKDE